MIPLPEPDDRRGAARADLGMGLVVLGAIVAVYTLAAWSTERGGAWSGLVGLALVLAGARLVRRDGRSPAGPAVPADRQEGE